MKTAWSYNPIASKPFDALISLLDHFFSLPELSFWLDFVVGQSFYVIVIWGAGTVFPTYNLLEEEERCTSQAGTVAIIVPVWRVGVYLNYLLNNLCLYAFKSFHRYHQKINVPCLTPIAGPKCNSKCKPNAGISQYTAPHCYHIVPILPLSRNVCFCNCYHWKGSGWLLRPLGFTQRWVRAQCPHSVLLGGPHCHSKSTSVHNGILTQALNCQSHISLWFKCRLVFILQLVQMQIGLHSPGDLICRNPPSYRCTPQLCFLWHLHIQGTAGKAHDK